VTGLTRKVNGNGLNLYDDDHHHQSRILVDRRGVRMNVHQSHTTVFDCWTCSQSHNYNISILAHRCSDLSTRETYPLLSANLFFRLCQEQKGDVCQQAIC